MKIAIASDHRGYGRKEEIKNIVLNLGHDPHDFGTSSEENTDYPDYAFKAVEAVSSGVCERAILICYSGIGMSIAANKVNGIRAALCYDEEAIELSRAHNDANVLVLPAKIEFGDGLPGMIQVWIEMDFEGGRHRRRLEKISQYEEKR